MQYFLMFCKNPIVATYLSLKKMLLLNSIISILNFLSNKFE